VNEEFIAKLLGTYRTVYGDLSRSEVARIESIRIEAERSIAACKQHKKERCRCWARAREELFELRRSVGEKTPLAISALALWNSLEALARNRLKRQDHQATESEPDVQPGIIYNWRHFKCPDYMNQILRSWGTHSGSASSRRRSGTAGSLGGLTTRLRRSESIS
jgi:hypothetical protein